MTRSTNLTRRQMLMLAAGGALSSAAMASAERLSVEAARQAALDGEIVLIDIRTPAEWRESGVADVAHPLSMIDRNFGRDFVALLEANPGKKPAFICALGTRSRRLIRLMAQRGLTETVDVPDGMHGKPNGWLARGLPTTAWPPVNQ